MGQKITIAAAKRISKDSNLDQVIVIGWSKDDGITRTATYGKTIKDCAEAAQGRDRIMKFLGLKMEKE